MPKININGIVREMTAEEIEDIVNVWHNWDEE